MSLSRCKCMVECTSWEEVLQKTKRKDGNGLRKVQWEAVPLLNMVGCKTMFVFLMCLFFIDCAKKDSENEKASFEWYMKAATSKTKPHLASQYEVEMFEDVVCTNWCFVDW